MKNLESKHSTKREDNTGEVKESNQSWKLEKVWFFDQEEHCLEELRKRIKTRLKELRKQEEIEIQE